MTPPGRLDRTAVVASLRERVRLRVAADPEGVTHGVMTPATMGAVPNTPGTPRRTIRVADALWEAAAAKAAERGESLSDVIRHALERYVRRR